MITGSTDRMAVALSAINRGVVVDEATSPREDSTQTAPFESLLREPAGQGSPIKDGEDAGG